MVAVGLAEVTMAEIIKAGGGTHDMDSASHTGGTEGDLVVKGGSDWDYINIGANATVLTSNGTTAIWAAQAGGGDVSAGAVMTDHAVVRGDGGTDTINLDDVPDFGDGTNFSVMAVFSTDNDASGSDPKIFSVNNSSAVEKVRMDWNDPVSGEEARFRLTIGGTERAVVFSEAMQQDRFYTSMGRFDGATTFYTLWDWTTSTLNEGSTAGTGALDSVSGGTASIGNNAGTKNREWGGNVYALFIFNSALSEGMARWMVMHPYHWLQTVNTDMGTVIAAVAGGFAHSQSIIVV